MQPDSCFDGIASTFEAEIYGTTKGRVRLEVLWTDLLTEIPEIARGGLSCLDAGGGAGHMALHLARSGNKVVLSDPSTEMLSRAEEAIRNAGLPDRVSLVRAPIQELHQQVGDQFDIVLCHAVLEWVADPKAALGQLLKFVKPNGRLSLLFYNSNAALQRRIFRGECLEAVRELEDGCARRDNGCLPLGEASVRGWLEEFGFAVRSKAGIRIFHDYLPNALRASERLGGLLEAEKTFRKREPFASLGHHLHLICEKIR